MLSGKKPTIQLVGPGSSIAFNRLKHSRRKAIDSSFDASSFECDIKEDSDLLLLLTPHFKASYWLEMTS